MNRPILVLCLAVATVVTAIEEDVKGGEDVLEIENGPFWKHLTGTRSENGHRSFYSDPPKVNKPDNANEDQRKISLEELLKSFAKKHLSKNGSTEEEPTHDAKLTDDNKDRSKSTWAVDAQRHKYPSDDRNGWVSLDPVPWSISKISKWQSKYKPASERPWNEYGPISTPYFQEPDSNFNRPVSVTPPSPYIYHHRPTESSDRYDVIYSPRPTSYPRPTAYFGHKVHLEANFPSNSYSSTGRPSYFHNNKDCQRPNHPFDHHDDDDDGGIITDGLPSNFPQPSPSPYNSLRRRGDSQSSETHSETHPFNGDGEWVLLSTTKGYKPPRHRQRSLAIDAPKEGEAVVNRDVQTLRASRGVRLTVLPPLKGSNVNMTTSHGGLLQVESTFESVEEAKRNFDKKQDRIKLKAKRKRRKPAKKTTGLSTTSASDLTEPGAVAAAVGAGLIPATMAMMVPVALSGG